MSGEINPSPWTVSISDCTHAAVAVASVLHSAAVGGFVAGDEGPSRHLGNLTAANWVSFDFNISYSSC